MLNDDILTFSHIHSASQLLSAIDPLLGRSTVRSLKRKAYENAEVDWEAFKEVASSHYCSRCNTARVSRDGTTCRTRLKFVKQQKKKEKVLAVSCSTCSHVDFLPIPKVPSKAPPPSVPLSRVETPVSTPTTTSKADILAKSDDQRASKPSLGTELRTGTLRKRRNAKKEELADVIAKKRKKEEEKVDSGLLGFLKEL
ncbi:hypothetical protein BT69DRAFT_1357899 [Atractiella rhizophila]|nr:hypothetical protein BT69DRAFT_1357899 [Atractiella rhizophila]